MAELAVGEDRLNGTVQLGDRLLVSTAVSGREDIRQQLASARMMWNQLSKDIAERCCQCQERDNAVRTLTDSLTELNAWLDESEKRLIDAKKCRVETLDESRDQLKTLKV